MAAPGAQFNLLRDIVEANLAKLTRIAASRRQPRSVRAEGEATHLVSMSAPGRRHLPGRDVHQLHLLVTPERELRAIRAEAERADGGTNPGRGSALLAIPVGDQNGENGQKDNRSLNCRDHLHQ